MKRIAPLLLCVLMTLPGCAGQSKGAKTTRLAAAQSAYNARDYGGAFTRATQLYATSRGADRDEAAYLAGLSAHRLNNPAGAEKYLGHAAGAKDKALAADANVELGLMHSEQGRYDLAARDLLRAAAGLEGEDKARAYFYAAVAQQKLGQWAQARTNLVLARSATRQADFRAQVEAQLDVTGYTIQVGAFRGDTNARAAADRAARAAEGKQVGQPRLVASQDSTGQAVTLVHVGRFATFSAASQARQRLGNMEAIVVPLSK